MLELLQAQLGDPMRIVMLAALVAIALKERPGLDAWPMILGGAVFVALLLAMMTPGVTPLASIPMGLVANAVMLVPMLGLAAIWLRWRAGRRPPDE